MYTDLLVFGFKCECVCVYFLSFSLTSLDLEVPCYMKVCSRNTMARHLLLY